MFFNKKLISTKDEERLIASIKAAELNTSGEIRIHITKYCKGDALEACKKQFEQLNMHQTKDRNAILFYLAIKSKTFSVWGDEGIHLKVHDEFWKEITQCAIDYFKKGDIVLGLETSVKMCGEKLKLYFPYHSNDKNELSDNVSFS